MENTPQTTAKPPRINRRILSVFQGKYEAKKYEDIAKETGYSIKTLYTNFKKTGKWYQPYLDYEKELNDEIIRAAKEMHRKGALDASKVNLAALAYIQSYPKIALAAAHDIL